MFDAHDWMMSYEDRHPEYNSTIDCWGEENCTCPTCEYFKAKDAMEARVAEEEERRMVQVRTWAALPLYQAQA